MNYDEALETALNLAQDPAALESFLGTVPAWAGQLRREVRLASSIGSELRAISPTAAVASRRQQELLARVGQLKVTGASPRTTRVSVLIGLLTSVTRPRLLATATLAAAVVVLVLLGGFPALNSNGPVVAEAVVIEGSVSEIGAGVVTISTASSAELVQFSNDTVLTDGFGNPLQASDLNAGQTVILKGSRSDTGVVASTVELKDRLFGTITALTSESMSLRSGQGSHVIRITPETEIEDALRVGLDVEVKVLRLADGTLRALEIESEDEEDERDGDDNEGRPSGSASPVPSGTSPSAGPSPGASDDDSHEAGEDHEDESSADGEDHEDQSSGEDEDEHEEQSDDGHESEDD